MQRVDTPDERFHDGNPATGALGTPVNASILNALQEEVCQTIELSGLDLDPGSTRQLYDAIVRTIASKVQAPVFVGTTPSEKVGDLIFVLDRMHWATWVQTAFYTGYRSLNVGDWYIGSMCMSHRPQEIDAIGGIYDIAAFPSLWGWAQEQGKVVDAGDWEPHGTQYALIGTTQFRVPDYRNMFPRAAGTDADTANPRGAGSYQSDALQNIVGNLGRTVSGGGSSVDGAFQVMSSGGGVSGSTTSVAQVVDFDAGRVVRISTETRGASAAVAAAILI
jgi:hypothetical protein